MDQKPFVARRALLGACAGLLLFFGYCSTRPSDPSMLHARFGLPHVPPPYGTDQPLDSGRLAAVISDPGRLRAAMPIGAGLDSALWADLGRLSWLWSTVKGADTASETEWVEAATREIAATVVTYRNWPIPGVTGPATEAAMLERVPQSELTLLANRRQEIRAFFEALHPPTRDAEYATIRATDPEALGWLRRADAETGLAGNRFDSAEEGAEFVEALYAAGAAKVVITSESIQQEGPSEWYADAIRIALPDDPTRRAALFRIVNAEAEDQGFDAEKDTGQPVLFMWWD